MSLPGSGFMATFHMQGHFMPGTRVNISQVRSIVRNALREGEDSPILHMRRSRPREEMAVHHPQFCLWSPVTMVVPLWALFLLSVRGSEGPGHLMISSV